MTRLDGLAEELDHHLLAIELVHHRVLEDVPCQLRVLKYKIKPINSFGRFLYLHILELILLFCSSNRSYRKEVKKKNNRLASALTPANQRCELLEPMSGTIPNTYFGFRVC